MIRETGLIWTGRILLAAAVIPPLVHVVPLNRLTRWLARATPSRPRPRSPDDQLLARWVDGLLRRLPWPWHRTCLKRGAVLFYLLGAAGRPAELRIGVRRPPGASLAAHAWLVRDGEVILEPGSENVQSFETIARFPEPTESIP